MIEIRQIRKTDSAKLFNDYINTLIVENTFLGINEKQTLEQEKKWINERLDAIRKRNEIYLVAFDNNKIAGTCWARKDRWKEDKNVSLGIAIAKNYRGKGLGERLLRMIIKKSKQILKPRNIYLSVYAKNKPAHNLYHKLGFRKFAIFPKWIKHREEFMDKIFMILK